MNIVGICLFVILDITSIKSLCDINVVCFDVNPTTNIEERINEKHLSMKQFSRFQNLNH